MMLLKQPKPLKVSKKKKKEKPLNIKMEQGNWTIDWTMMDIKLVI